MVAYSFKKRFVDPIRAGLGLPFQSLGAIVAPKQQTIRSIGKRRHARPGETVQLYTAMRTRQCEKIGDGLCTAVLAVHIKFARAGDSVSEFGGGFSAVSAGAKALDLFAQRDGFSSWDEMREFWREEHPDVRVFRGVMVQWEPLS